MTERTFIFQKDGGGKEERINIDINKTVNDLISKYLEGKNLKESTNDFAFMVGVNPLKKEKYINSQIKNVRFLRPNTVIKVREVDTKAGGRF
jgi:hypothetical protein